MLNALNGVNMSLCTVVTAAHGRFICTKDLLTSTDLISLIRGWFTEFCMVRFGKLIKQETEQTASVVLGHTPHAGQQKQCLHLDSKT